MSGFKNTHNFSLKILNLSLGAISLCASNMLIILGVIVNIVGGNMYDYLTSTRIFIVIMIRIYI